jgi:glycerate kinase
VDGGVGAAMALGWQFLDAQGNPIGFGGGELERIAKIVPPIACHSERSEESQLLGKSVATTETLRFAQGDNIRVDVLCDVDNPLCGPHGAARVFGPQKGATPEMIERLDAGLRHLAELVKAQLGKDIAEVPGAGAAGGLAAGALAFMDAQLVPGVDAVAEAIDLDGALSGADWAITGEGRFDEQSWRGKVVSGVASRARKLGVKVAVLAGSVTLTEREWRERGIEIVLATQEEGMPLDHAMANAGKLLAEKARELAVKL